MFRLFIVGLIFMPAWTAPATGQDDSSGEPLLVEGDILKRNAVLKEQQWPDGIINYRFDNGYSQEQQQQILSAMGLIEAVSCVRFIESNGSTHYVLITPNPSNPSCSSQVGVVEQRHQNLTLATTKFDCFEEHGIVHELLHSVGLWHQHTAPNRDDYVKIIYENIKPEWAYNFDKLNSSDFGVPYDYNSLLHYPNDAFAKAPGLITMEAIKSGAESMGNATKMSKYDIKKLNIMYNCTQQFDK